VKLPRLDKPHPPPIPARDVQSEERYEDELIMSLERDQFVAETSRPLPRAVLTRGVVAALWGLRIFVTLLGLMVVYTFVYQLH
jgi:hypothetical protein